MQRDGGACWWFTPWKKLDQEWQVTTTRAQQHLSKIADSIQKTTYLDGEHWGALSDCYLLQERASSRLWDLVHRCRKRLHDDIDTLADVVHKMKALLTENPSKKKIDERLQQRYETFLLELVAMYERELVTKSLIAADMAECAQHDVMTLYIASWQMQPHLDRARIDEILQLIQNDAHYR
ncbi:hypothetical protein Poli38472_009728 [Pythium oligandrum]|uniref:Uncharacterized protein n=1 Tax=Pythium oligandrum TaxID=41045 RepID=A0A8K1FG02_PYTOL|nr:hypothetical protein Poli38472_009728 [Pythium oligandrum]|eukprot:TMW62235.1 hypothetical protein Poli38472_009728 [Pythium oligandrum]